jgi:CTP synthase
MLEQEKLDEVIIEKLGLTKRVSHMQEWTQFVDRIHNKDFPSIKIAIVGKYTSLSDSYLSVVEALKHAAAANECRVDIEWVEAEIIEQQGAAQHLTDVVGILIPGGFGSRGIEGKILAAQFARERNIPYLGLCLGMHIAVIEFARHVLGHQDAHSTEFNPETHYPVIDFLENQKSIQEKGGTMRLGTYPCTVKPGSRLYEAYQSLHIDERHRHRYEFNNAYKADFESKGMVFSGASPDNSLVEVVELPNLLWFVACQFHPEFKSRPYKSHPLFKSFVHYAKVYAFQTKVL